MEPASVIINNFLPLSESSHSDGLKFVAKYMKCHSLQKKLSEKSINNLVNIYKNLLCTRNGAQAIPLFKEFAIHEGG